MENNTDITSGERLSFYKLFSEKKYHLEIPIIQRDYAQGRETKSEVREQFLDSLFSYLNEGVPERDLDFVYGTLFKNGEMKFIPLDGQQRLTTLFLLHWYLANISSSMPAFNNVLSKDGKSKFTYETRTSSREFCDALLSNHIDIENLLPADENKKNGLSKTIRNCGWFFLSWENDPTIQSMLVMLDAIHAKFEGKINFFELLTHNEKPVITFQFLNLKDFKLTDDLYIKMNSRGKPLTTFENFKAKFEQYLGTLEWDPTLSFKLDYGDGARKVTAQEYFSHKIDTDWANLFWNYRNLHQHNQAFDDELMNFIRVILTNQYAADCKDVSDINLGHLIGSQNVKDSTEFTDEISYYRFKNLGALTQNGILYLIQAFDKLVNGCDKIRSLLKQPSGFDEQQIFEKILTDKLTLTQRVQFHAYVKYLITNDNIEGLDQWMRVICNLSENTVLDSFEDFAKAVKSIETLLPYSNNILEFLRTNPTPIDFFTGRQVQEEKIKAHLLKISEEWKQAIENVELHPYLRGQIGFLLDYCNIINYFENKGNCLWSADDDKNVLQAFVNYIYKASAAISIIDTDNNKNFIWERAVLTKGDYLIEADPRFNFLSTNKRPRDYSWKRLLRLPPLGASTEEWEKWKEKREFVKAVLDDPDFNLDDVKKSLEKICKNVPNDWRKYFVLNPDLIKYCTQGFIQYLSEKNILLFKHSQVNHTHAELFTYNLYLKEFIGKDGYAPFKRIWYAESAEKAILPFISLFDWAYKRKQFEFLIYFDDTDSFLEHPYQMKFSKKQGLNKINDYPEEIRDLLQEMKFIWFDEEPGFWISAKTESKTMDLIKTLCSKLQSI